MECLELQRGQESLVKKEKENLNKNEIMYGRKESNKIKSRKTGNLTGDRVRY